MVRSSSQGGLKQCRAKLRSPDYACPATHLTKEEVYLNFQFVQGGDPLRPHVQEQVHVVAPLKKEQEA